jgi:adenosylhomocysteinase
MTYPQKDSKNNQKSTLPKQIDETIAQLKLKTMNITIDKLTAEQQKYLQTWEIGTT